MNKKTLMYILLVLFSSFILIYQLELSESARIKKNLDDFGKVESFFSSKISQTDIENIEKKKENYSFTIVNSKEVSNFKMLGKVYMIDNNGDLLSSFILYKYAEKYLICMRNVYMLL